MKSESFERDVLVASFRDPKFLVQFSERIEQIDFGNEIYGEVWLLIRKLYRKFHERLTLNVLGEELLKAIDQQLFYKEDVPILIELLEDLESADVAVAWTTEELKRWISERAHQRFTEDAQTAVEDGQPHLLHEAYQRLTARLSIGDDEEDFMDRMGDIAEQMERFKTGFIRTGIPDLDVVMGGGYLKGEFAALWAADGLGKSWLIQQMGMNAVTQLFRTLHLTTEMSKLDTEGRYVGLFTNINVLDLSDNVDRVRQIQQRHKDLRGLLTVKYLESGTDILQIRSILDQAILEDKPYDLVIIDYVDKLAKRERADWLELEDLFARLADMRAVFTDPDHQPAIWAVTHSNADGYDRPHPSRKAMGRSKVGKSKSLDFSLVLGQDKSWKERRIVQASISKDPRKRIATKRKCLLRHDEKTATFYSIPFEEVEV